MKEITASSLVGFTISRLNVTAGTVEALASRGLKTEWAYNDSSMSLKGRSSKIKKENISNFQFSNNMKNKRVHLNRKGQFSSK